MKTEYDPKTDPLAGILPSSQQPQPEREPGPIEQLRKEYHERRSGAWANLVCDVCGETFSGFHKLNRARDRCCPTCYALDTCAGMDS